MAGPFRGTPAGYLRAAAATGPALLTTSFTAVVWFNNLRTPVSGNVPRLVDSQGVADGWGIRFNTTTVQALISTSAGAPGLNVANVPPGLGVALLSWDGATLRCRVRNVGSNSVAHGGVPSGAPNQLCVGTASASPSVNAAASQESTVGGFIVQSAFRINPANEVAYLDSVATALSQDRDVPLPDGSAGGATDWYFDARDWADPSMSWVDRINGYALPVVGAPQQSCYAGVPY